MLILGGFYVLVSLVWAFNSSIRWVQTITSIRLVLELSFHDSTVVELNRPDPSNSSISQRMFNSGMIGLCKKAFSQLKIELDLEYLYRY